MTHLEQKRFLGRHGFLRYKDGMQFEVRCIDIRESRGQPQALVVPVPQTALYRGSSWKSVFKVLWS
jgi:hypothetical protein